MSKKLVAYFSATGTTRAAAEKLAKAASADLYEIKAALPYTTGDLVWTNEKSRSTIEMHDKSFRPLLPTKTLILLIIVDMKLFIMFFDLVVCCSDHD